MISTRVQLVLALSEPNSLKARPKNSNVRLASSFCSRRRISFVCPRVNLSSAAVKLSKCGFLPCPRAIASSPGPKEFAFKLSQRTLSFIGTYPRHFQCVLAAGVVVFALLGLAPSVQFLRRHIFQRRDWEKSRTKQIVMSYIRPLVLWGGILVICRGLDPLVLSSETSQAVKNRFVKFLRSLSTVLTFAFCTARLTQQVQKLMMNRHSSEESRNRGIRFIGSAVSTSVWVAAVALFMELLGFSTQKWLTAGGFGTVLLTLAGREIFTNFLSSVMIHATRPFVEFEWIQTKIDGQEVSGTVEHVGWWGPTVIRGDDREAVHIPNHKFTMSVVRNLSQKTHWRIKTYIGLSHLDASKINLIVADMRKVLSKHPHVEHRKLHRRVFFDNIDPVNQSLMIMISCFVKTSHFEEYLSVKEIILLNLLKVISHHNARLATPIRSVQRVYDDAETRQSPYRTVSHDGKPLLLVEASAVAAENMRSSSSTNTTTIASNNPQEVSTSPVQEKQQQQALEGLDSMGLSSKDMSLLGAAFEKPPVKISEASPEADNQGNAVKQKGEAKEGQEGSKKTVKTTPSPSSSTIASSEGSKKNVKTTPSLSSSTIASSTTSSSSCGTGESSGKRAENSEGDPWKEEKKSSSAKSLEDNLVLGVALAGSKRTLPLDDEVEEPSMNSSSKLA